MKIIALGECLWDQFPDGRQIGGAAGNFVYHAVQAGADARLISAVGRDKDGEALTAALTQRGVPHTLKPNALYPTGKVEVTLDRHGVPQYDILSPVAWDVIPLDVTLMVQVREADVFYFGSLVQRHSPNQRLMRMLVAMLPPGSKIVVDINLRQGHYTPQVVDFCLRQAHLLKLNDEELPLIAAMFSLPRDPAGFYQHLRQTAQLEMLMYTQGSRGSILLRGEEQDVLAGQKVKTVDTVGAGDAFTAVATVMALRQEPLAAINLAASRVAAYVCTCPGGMPSMASLTD